MDVEQFRHDILTTDQMYAAGDYEAGHGNENHINQSFVEAIAQGDWGNARKIAGMIIRMNRKKRPRRCA